MFPANANVPGLFPVRRNRGSILDRTYSPVPTRMTYCRRGLPYMDHNCVTSVGCINVDDIVEFGLNLVELFASVPLNVPTSEMTRRSGQQRAVTSVPWVRRHKRMVFVLNGNVSRLIFPRLLWLDLPSCIGAAAASPTSPTVFPTFGARYEGTFELRAMCEESRGTRLWPQPCVGKTLGRCRNLRPHMAC
jgi:hypothetical protein